MFGIDPVEMAKKEVLKFDLNKNGTPDAIEACDAFEAACDAIAPFVARIDHLDVLSLLTAAIAHLPSAKFSKEEKELFAIALMNALRAFGKVKPFIEGVETELKKTKK